MAQPYVGEIRMFAGNFAPAGWMFCEGQLLPISEYETLFQLIGTTYGGDGQNTFALPDLRGRMPIHQGSGPGLSSRVLAESFGTETVTVTSAQMPAHNHALLAYNGVANTPNPANNLLGLSTQVNMYFDDNPNQDMNAGIVTSTGGSQPHENMQPFLCVDFIISLFGIFPSPS
ncbi:MAG: phage tail protein [Chitinophagales bacterium]|nr:phage tail protein [Chitinophagales bacterium]